MKNKITLTSVCFLTFFVSSNIFAQKTEVPTTNSQTDLPFGVTSFNRLAVDLKKPEYLKAARDANVTGRVELWIEVDEKGTVTSARPVSGPEELKEASVAAALASKFKPFEFQGKIYKAVGPIAFYFPEANEKEHIERLKMCLLSEWINSGFFGIPFLTESWAKEVDAIDPSIFKEVMESEEVKNGGRNEPTVLLDGVTAKLEKRFTGEKLWYFQFGKKLGKLDFVLLTDGPEADFRARLNDIREHAKTMPSDFPIFAAGKLRSLVGLLDNKQLTIEEFKRQLETKASEMRQFLGGELPVPAN